jgi:REP element-mobilizing transposase RayT
MFIQPYGVEELALACCFRAYYRWRTHCLHVEPALARLDRATLASLLSEYGVHVLESSATETDVKVLASFLPAEAVASGASKLKGRVSKWLRVQSGSPHVSKLLSRGYFACTTGASTAQAVAAYLDRQGEHHGYLSRPLPPVFVESYPLLPHYEKRLTAAHAVTLVRFHVVLSTWKRRGLFSRPAAQATADCWQKAQIERSFFIEKVSFLPDHVHLAVRLHPSRSPASAVVALMNASQELMWADFAGAVVQAGVDRLWQARAYIGSFGELESRKIAAYVRKWEATEGTKSPDQGI